MVQVSQNGAIVTKWSNPTYLGGGSQNDPSAINAFVTQKIKKKTTNDNYKLQTTNNHHFPLSPLALQFT